MEHYKVGIIFIRGINGINAGVNHRHSVVYLNCFVAHCVGTAVLMYGKEFKACMRGIIVAYMQCVAVLHEGTPLRLKVTVILYLHTERACDVLVLSVTVNIGYGTVVVSVSYIFICTVVVAGLTFFRIKAVFCIKSAVFKAYTGNACALLAVSAEIVAARINRVRLFSVKIRHACHKAVRAVSEIVSEFLSFIVFDTCGGKVYCVHCRTCFTVEYS